MKRRSAPGEILPTVPGFFSASSELANVTAPELGRAVEFVDHRPPPFDHRALDVGGTGRGGMDDVAQRRHVVFVADLLRQLHQPDEHGRHHEDGVDFFSRDHAQKLLGVEARHEHQRAAETAGAQAERVRRGMIERPGKQRAGARLEAVDHPAHCFGVRGLLRRRCGAAHALGMACGARGVDHVLRLRHRRPVIARVLLQPGFEVDREIGRRQMIGIDLVVGDDFRRRRHAERGDAFRDRLAQLMQHVGMRDQHGRAGILQHIVDLFRLEVPVDGHAIGAEPHRGIGRLDEGDVVAHQHGDAVALLDAKFLQAAGDALRAIGDFVVAAPARAADDAEEGGCRLTLSCSDLSSGS